MKQTNLLFTYQLPWAPKYIDLVDELDGGTQEELGCEFMQTWQMKVGWDMWIFHFWWSLFLGSKQTEVGILKTVSTDLGFVQGDFVTVLCLVSQPPRECLLCFSKGNMLLGTFLQPHCLHVRVIGMTRASHGSPCWCDRYDWHVVPVWGKHPRQLRNATPQLSTVVTVQGDFFVLNHGNKRRDDFLKVSATQFWMSKCQGV